MPRRARGPRVSVLVRRRVVTRESRVCGLVACVGLKVQLTTPLAECVSLPFTSAHYTIGVTSSRAGRGTRSSSAPQSPHSIATHDWEPPPVISW